MISEDNANGAFAQYASSLCKLGLGTSLTVILFSVVTLIGRLASHRSLIVPGVLEAACLFAPVAVVLRYRARRYSLRRLLAIGKVSAAVIGIQMAWLMWDVSYLTMDREVLSRHGLEIFSLFAFVFIMISLAGGRFVLFVRRFGAYAQSGVIDRAAVFDIVGGKIVAQGTKSGWFPPGLAVGIWAIATVGIGVAVTGQVLFVLCALLISPFLLGLAVAQHIALMRTLGRRDLRIL